MSNTIKTFRGKKFVSEVDTAEHNLTKGRRAKKSAFVAAQNEKEARNEVNEYLAQAAKEEQEAMGYGNN